MNILINTQKEHKSIMVAPPPIQNPDIHKKLLDLKFRISEKKVMAGRLFDDITSENQIQHRMQKPLEAIRDILQKQQEEDGHLDSDKIH